MNYHPSLRLMSIVMLAVAVLGVGLGGWAGLAQAASGSITAVEAANPTLPPAIPPQYPQAADLVADLSITKTNSVDTIIPGQTTTYVIIVTNNDADDTVDATVTDTFPAELTSTTWTCSGTAGATCTAGGSSHINDNANLPPGSSVTYVVTGTVSAEANSALVNRADLSVLGGVTDPDLDNNSATDTDTLTPQADLSITKTNGQDTTIPGNSTAYTIVVSNNGPSSANGTTIQDNFPTKLTGVTWSRTASGGTCPSTGSSDINCTIDLPPGSSVTFTVTGTVNPDETGTLVNTASLNPAGGVTDTSSNNDIATDSDTLTPQADLSITKTNTQVSPVPGTSTTYILTISHNSGPSNISQAVVADNFPASLSGITWTCGGIGGGNCQGPTNGSGNLNGKLINLPIGSSVIFTATGLLDADASGILTNTATVSMPANGIDPTPDNNSATDSRTLNPQANLAITKTNGQSKAVPGTGTIYTIVISNSGPSSAPVVTVTDNFPSISGVTWTCSDTGGAVCPANNGNDSLNDTVNLPVGGSVTFVAGGEIDPAARETLTNTAAIILPAGVTDPDLSNNTATDVDPLEPSANLQVNKTDSPSTVIAGNILTYTITVNNLGPSEATNVTLFDTLSALPPPAVNYISATPSQGSCSHTGGIVTCPLLNLGQGSSASVIVKVQVPSSRLEGQTLINNPASVTATEPDANTGNNQDSEPTGVIVRTDLAISKTTSSASVALGNLITYTLRVTNNGPSDATGVTVTDSLPGGAGGVNLVSVSSTLGSCIGTTTISCSLGDMVSGSVATITLVVNPKAIGTVSNTATVTSVTNDPTSGNNSSTVSTLVSRITDLAITQSSTPNHVIEGENITYNLTVINNGPSDAISVTVVNTLPAEVAFQSVTPAACGHSSGVITCNLGTMANGSSVPIAIVANINNSVAGNIINTAVVTASSSSDPVPENNSTSAPAFVGDLVEVFLPLLLKPTPTDLFIENDTGGVVNFSVAGTGVSCSVPAGNQNFPCGSFPPGTYTVQVNSICGNLTASKYYESGPQSTRVFCN